MPFYRVIRKDLFYSNNLYAEVFAGKDNLLG